MDQIHHIRTIYYEQGKNLSEISRETGLDWKTVRKYIDKDDFNQKIPAPVSEKVLCPKLDPFKPLIDRWLEEDKLAPRKQQHTAQRIFDRLSKEADGVDCSYKLVTVYVAAKKEELHLDNKTGYIPLDHDPGESQADFGTADFFEDGLRMTGKYLTLTFPYSNHGYIQLFYGENTECLLEGLVSMFEHIVGVPSEIWFDNTKNHRDKDHQGRWP